MQHCTLSEHELARFPFADLVLPAAHDSGRLVLGGGCFWCTEAVFLALDGVTTVTSGYAGGHAAQANYDNVCSGVTGHAEVIEIRYQPERIGYTDLLRLFFAVAHDPTQLNRQGNDIGSQYRSVIFVSNEEERRVADAYIRQLDASGIFTAPIVTTLEPLDAFYTAEAYHQNYAARNPAQPYIRFAAAPKLEKLVNNFSPLLKQRDAGR